MTLLLDAQEGQPCCNEKLLLMFDRWRKLLKGFYDAKKKVFDISKVPDIYDSAKYDAIHNSELGLNVENLYLVGPTLSFPKASECTRDAQFHSLLCAPCIVKDDTDLTSKITLQLGVRHSFLSPSD